MNEWHDEGMRGGLLLLLRASSGSSSSRINQPCFPVPSFPCSSRPSLSLWFSIRPSLAFPSFSSLIFSISHISSSSHSFSLSSTASVSCHSLTFCEVFIMHVLSNSLLCFAFHGPNAPDLIITSRINTSLN